VAITDGPFFAETREHWAGIISSRQRTSMKPPAIAARIPGARVGSVEVRTIGHRWLEPGRSRAVLNMTARLADDVEEVFRRESGVVLATLIRLSRFRLAEEGGRKLSPPRGTMAGAACPRILAPADQPDATKRRSHSPRWPCSQQGSGSRRSPAPRQMRPSGR